MNKRNYWKEGEHLIKELDSVPRLLLHSCCAPCSTAVIAYLSEFFSVTVYFYNPNIDTDTEYERRKTEQIRFLQEFSAKNPVYSLTEPHSSETFSALTVGLELEPERGARCSLCFHERLRKTAETAKSLSIPYFTTTLTISPLKDADLINVIGEFLQTETLKWLPCDFKKKGGYQKSIALSKTYGLYRQNYCGCKFSRRDL